MLPYGYYFEAGTSFSQKKLSKIRCFLADLHLNYDETADYTVAIFSPQGEVAATASVQGNLFKCIGVSPLLQGEGLTATLMTCLLEYCGAHGLTQQFLYTKPENLHMFQAFGFEELVGYADAILMERPSGCLRRYLAALPQPPAGAIVGAIVAHCNPITLGHLYLIMQAKKQCDFLYLFILSEDRGEVPAADRIQLVRQAVSDIPGIAVCPTQQYLISNATFPSYFLHAPGQVERAWCELDVRMFAKWFAPQLHITKRFLGTEPLSPVTAMYNQVLSDILPPIGVEVIVLERKMQGDGVISASRVRQLLRENQLSLLENLVPPCTMAYFSSPERCREAMTRLMQPPCRSQER